MRWVVAFVITMLAAGPAAAQAVVVTLSADEVRITSNFTGTTITVFGAVQTAALPPPTAPYDLAVLLKGPSAPMIVRRKDQVLGLWLNRAEARFASVPDFYALNTTAPLSELAIPAHMQAAGLGIANVRMVPEAGVAPAATSAFRGAVLRLKQEAGHYLEAVATIDRLGGDLFRTSFDLPADVPVGTYTATVFVFRDGAIIAEASQPLTISKIGAEQFVFDASRNNAWLYALVVILMAASIGWLGGIVFRRD